MEISFCGFRIKEGDFVPWNNVLAGNDNIVKITQRTASAIGSGRIPVDAARLCAQRGGDLDKLADALQAPQPPALTPAPPPPPEEIVPPAGTGQDNGEAVQPEGEQPPAAGELQPADFDSDFE